MGSNLSNQDKPMNKILTRQSTVLSQNDHDLSQIKQESIPVGCVPPTLVVPGEGVMPTGGGGAAYWRGVLPTRGHCLLGGCAA